MPFAVKKPHPQHSNVKVWHSWDPDGDGYEEIRKFKTQERAQQWINENHPTKNCEIVEITHEVGQDDDEIERKDQLAEDPGTPNGIMSNRNKDATKVGKLTTFTVDGEIED